MPQCINKGYINVKMKMRELQYTFNGLDLYIRCQGNDPEQYSKSC